MINRNRNKDEKVPTEERLRREERASIALMLLADYFYNKETPAKIIIKTPNLDYYDNRIIRYVNDNDTHRDKEFVTGSLFGAESTYIKSNYRLR